MQLTYLLLQLFMSTLALGAPLADGTVSVTNHAWQYGTGGGIVGFVVLILDIIVIIEVLQSDRAPPQKLLWCIVVFLFPVIGMLVYWLFSNREAHMRGYQTLP